MNPIIIEIEISLSPQGNHAHSRLGPMYDTWVNGKLMCGPTAQPFGATCRALLDQGTDPETKVIMRRKDSPIDALISTVGYAASKTVSEDRFVNWKPFIKHL